MKRASARRLTSAPRRRPTRSPAGRPPRRIRTYGRPPATCRDALPWPWRGLSVPCGPRPSPARSRSAARSAATVRSGPSLPAECSADCPLTSPRPRRRPCARSSGESSWPGKNSRGWRLPPGSSARWSASSCRPFPRSPTRRPGRPPGGRSSCSSCRHGHDHQTSNSPCLLDLFPVGRPDSPARCSRKATHSNRSCKVPIPPHIGCRMPLERVRSFARRS